MVHRRTASEARSRARVKRQPSEATALKAGARQAKVIVGLAEIDHDRGRVAASIMLARLGVAAAMVDLVTKEEEKEAERERKEEGTEAMVEAVAAVETEVEGVEAEAEAEVTTEALIIDEAGVEIAATTTMAVRVEAEGLELAVVVMVVAEEEGEEEGEARVLGSCLTHAPRPHPRRRSWSFTHLLVPRSATGSSFVGDLLSQGMEQRADLGQPLSPATDSTDAISMRRSTTNDWSSLSSFSASRPWTTTRSKASL